MRPFIVPGTLGQESYDFSNMYVQGVGGLYALFRTRTSALANMSGRIRSTG